MKNIVLVSQDRMDISEDRRLKIVKSIVSNTHYQIILLVINDAEDKDKWLAIEGVQEVITSREIEYIESMKGLDYETIIASKDFQLTVENGLYRLYADYQLDKYYYYAALAFWNRFFSEHEVHAVIHTKAYHGFAYDCCDIIARKKGIKYFHIFEIGYHDTFGIFSDYSLIKIFVGGCGSIEYLLQSSFEKSLMPPSKEDKNMVRHFLYKLGGNLLEDFIMRLVHWDWQPRSLIRKRKKISWNDKFRGYLQIMNTKRYLLSISKKPEYMDKYICYFMHLEPEAPIYVRSILESQLAIIKMLSESLPNGWILYVKEHPAQFDVNNDPAYHHLYDAPLFKTKKFYQKIASFPRVKLIDYRIKSKQLIINAQAVSSMLGTVLLEGVLNKKPVLVFSDLSAVAQISDVFVIHSYEDCKKALKKLEDGFYPKYDGADSVVTKYVFRGEYITENIAKMIM